MKKTYLVFVSVLVLSVVGCDMPSEVDSEIDNVEVSSIVMNSIDFDGNVGEVVIDINTLSRDRILKKGPNSDHVMVKGHMEWHNKDTDRTWKKSVNASGNATEGKGQVEVSSDIWGDAHGAVVCTYAEGNEAVVGMYVTNAKDPLISAYNEGSLVWFRLNDNGEGKNDPADQHYNTIWWVTNLATIEDAQDYLVNILSCEDLYKNYGWGIAKDITEGNFQIK